MAKPKRLLNEAAVLDRTGLKASGLDRLMKIDPTFPRPARIAERLKGWDEDEVNTWIAARLADREKAQP